VREAHIAESTKPARERANVLVVLVGVDGQDRLPFASPTMETASNAKQNRWLVIHDKYSLHR
jgi:hypothetical protein